jgi:hypothetical protein
MKVEQRFFLDVVDGLADGASVNQGIEGSPAVFPHLAETEVTVANGAAVGAEPATYLFVLHLLVKHGFFHRRTSFDHCTVFPVYQFLPEFRYPAA